MKKCSKCGYEGESKFCPECGAEMQEIVIEPIKTNETDINNNVITESLEKAPEDVSKPKNKKRSIKKIALIIAALVIIVAIFIPIYQMISRASFSSEEDMQDYCCGVLEHYEDGRLKHQLIISKYEVEEVFVMPIGSDKSLTVAIKKWHTKRGYIETSIGNIIILKNGTFKFDGNTYTYAGKELLVDTDTEQSTDDSNDEEKKTVATTGEKNALNSAESYLSGSSGFSETSLRRQLDFEGYTESEIDYAINNCGADWKKQCTKSAESYLSGSMSFSKEGLIEQLEYEGFDHDMVVEVVDEVY